MTASDRFRLDGKCALVTGGAGMLGIEHAAALADMGAHVVLADINEDGLARAQDQLKHLGAAISVQRMNVAVETDVEAARTAIESEVGPVDILVNNAAIDPKVTADGGPELSRLEHFPLPQWDKEIAVGLTGAFLCARGFGPSMASRGSGVILNIASDLSVFAPDQRLYRRADRGEHNQPVKPVTYSVIKTGLIGLTRYLAGYWAEHGVRVNALSPGGVYVNQPEEFVTRLTALIPLGRMAGRDEYRCAVQFLCSDASCYMTGQNVVMDGGRSVL